MAGRIALGRGTGFERVFFALDRVQVLGPLLISPAVIYILALVAFPLFMSVYFAFSSITTGGTGNEFVGLRNFERVIENPVFWRALRNSIIFTFGSLFLSFLLGTVLGYVLWTRFWGKRVVRPIILLPFVIPIALSTMAWRWIFDPIFSVINWFLLKLGITDTPILFLGDPTWAMISVMAVNVWRYFPFAGVLFLAALTSIPPDIIDAAKIDGASFIRRHFAIILPMIKPVVVVGTLFSVVFIYGDMSVVYLLTAGGPVSSTEIVPHQGFRIGVVAGDLATGSATTLFMLPVLVIVVILTLRLLRKE